MRASGGTIVLAYDLVNRDEVASHNSSSDAAAGARFCETLARMRDRRVSDCNLLPYRTVIRIFGAA
jgi:hypothetical protein